MLPSHICTFLSFTKKTLTNGSLFKIRVETLPSKTIKYRFKRGCYARRKVTTNLRFSRFWTVGRENPPLKKDSQIGSLFLIRVETLPRKMIKYRFTSGCYARRKVTTNLRFSHFWTVGWENPSIKKDLQTGSLFKIRVETLPSKTIKYRFTRGKNLRRSGGRTLQ